MIKDFNTLEITTIVPITGCVVDCVYCPQNVLKSSYNGERILTLDNFKRIMRRLPSSVRVTFAGFVEPWLNKFTTDMVLHASKTNPVSVFTTGVGLSVDDFRKIEDIKFDSGPNSGFVLHLPDNEGRSKHPITRRYLDLLEYIESIQHDIHNFHVMCMGTVHKDISYIWPEVPYYPMWSRAGNLFREVLLKPELMNHPFLSRYREGEHTCGCIEGLYHNVLLPNGDVSLCCMDYSLEYIIGNLFEQTYEDILPQDKTCYKLCNFCENGVKP